MDAFVTFAGTGLRFLGYGLAWLILVPLVVLAVPRLTMRPALTLANRLDRISGFFFHIAMVAAVLIIVFQIAGVILRYVFGLSFSWMSDTVIFSFATIFMLGAAATLRDDEHVRVDILRTRYGERTRLGVELAGALLFVVPISVLILYSGSGLIARAWLDLQPFNESDGLPVKYLFKTLVPIFAVLMIGQAIANAIRAAVGLRTNKATPAPDHSGSAI